MENRLVQTVNIEGIKSSNIQEAILKSLSLKEKSPFVESEISKDLTNIKNSLIQEGYYFSNVSSKIIMNDNNTVNIIFDIELGKKSKILKISFIYLDISKRRLGIPFWKV